MKFLKPKLAHRRAKDLVDRYHFSDGQGVAPRCEVMHYWFRSWDVRWRFIEGVVDDRSLLCPVAHAVVVLHFWLRLDLFAFGFTAA